MGRSITAAPPPLSASATAGTTAAALCRWPTPCPRRGGGRLVGGWGGALAFLLLSGQGAQTPPGPHPSPFAHSRFPPLAPQRREPLVVAVGGGERWRSPPLPCASPQKNSLLLSQQGPATPPPLNRGYFYATQLSSHSGGLLCRVHRPVGHQPLCPLLFLTFQREFSLSLDQIALLITVNFLVQLCVDGLSARFVDIRSAGGYAWWPPTCLLHWASFCWLCCPADPPLAGLTTAVVVYALGGGLLEVLVSPIAEACPTRRKSAVMGLLHSFYCWGSVATIALSTLFFVCFGTQNWRILAILWALPPGQRPGVYPGPPGHSHAGGRVRPPLGQLFRTPRFWLFLLLMACAGASELSISQWASAFAESALGVCPKRWAIWPDLCPLPC